VAREASQRPSASSVVLSDSSPVAPIKAELPKYPPIARAAHVEGTVSISLQVTPEGQTKNVSFNGDKLLMLHGAVEEAVRGWKFPESPDGHMEHATLEFRLNCPASPKPQ
jgi:TonB family protein